MYLFAVVLHILYNNIKERKNRRKNGVGGTWHNTREQKLRQACLRDGVVLRKMCFYNIFLPCLNLWWCDMWKRWLELEFCQLEKNYKICWLFFYEREEGGSRKKRAKERNDEERCALDFFKTCIICS